MSQAQATNSHALIMVGLTTTAPNQVVTPQVLLGDYDGRGRWFPGTGSIFPVDGAPVLGTLRLPSAFLQALAPQLGY